MNHQVGIRSYTPLDLHDHSTVFQGGAVPLGSISGHTKVPHDALNIDADTVDGEEANAIVTKARCDALGIDHATLGNVLTAQHHALPNSAELTFALACRAYRTTSEQVLVSEALTKIEFNAEDYDLGGIYDHVTNHNVTIPSNGYYRIASQVEIQAETDGTTMELSICKDNNPIVTFSKKTSGLSFDDTISVFSIEYLVTNDVIDIRGRHYAGSDKNASLGRLLSFLCISKIGE